MLYLKEKTENKFVKLFSNSYRLLYTFVILIENMWCFLKSFLTYGFYFNFLSYLGRVKLFFNDNFPKITIRTTSRNVSIAIFGPNIYMRVKLIFNDNLF